MRQLLIIFLIAPSVCTAMGADSVEFTGVTKNGDIIAMTYNKEDDGSYGSKNNPDFKYCHEKFEESSKKNKYESKGLYCSSDKDQEPTSFYASANYNWKTKIGERYPEAMEFFKVAVEKYLKKEGGDEKNLFNYYYCVEGCHDKSPVFIFLWTYAD